MKLVAFARQLLTGAGMILRLLCRLVRDLSAAALSMGVCLYAIVPAVE